jgi:flagellar basal body rod protein FlgB
MSIFNNSLSTIMNQRLQWLNKRGQVITSNIANAEIPSMARKELRSFKQIVKRQNQLGNQKVIDYNPLQIGVDDVFKTKSEISREMETLEMTHNNIEHDALINIVRSLHKMMRTIVGRSQ